MTLTGLYLANQGELGLPITLPGVLKNVSIQTLNYLFNHPKEYIWHKELIPAFRLVSSLFVKSAGLLLASLIIAIVIGGGLGITAALSKRKNTAPIIVFTSILGVSTPSFLLGMLFWVINVKIMRLAGLSRAILPPIGFGWDNHLVMPAMVLAARPLAQIMQLTYISLSDILNQDYMRSARAKGLSERLQLIRHALPNILIPVLTTLGTSLRFSLASLPVVESFFIWEGIGLAILLALPLQMPALITDLIVTLGLIFLIINFSLEILYTIIDPRLRKDTKLQEERNYSNWTEQWTSFKETFKDTVKGFSETLKNLIVREKNPTFIPAAISGILKSQKHLSCKSKNINSLLQKKNGQTSEESRIKTERKRILRSAFSNIPFMFGIILLLGLIFLAFFGGTLTQANPFETHSIISIEGTVFGPPFKPVPQFPWGSDLLGRDIQALVLSGARQTLTLAVLATIARMLLGISPGDDGGLVAGKPDRSVYSGLNRNLVCLPNHHFCHAGHIGIGYSAGDECLYYWAVCSRLG